MKPLVSVGMPVHNESRFIEKTLRCFTSQTYSHFELIISDNASSDDTRAICEQYANDYDWIQYHRFEENQGPTPNFHYVLNQSTGRYFMWASGHDWWSQNYIDACVNEFEAHPKAAIVFGTSNWIDEHDRAFNREYGWCDTRGMGLLERYFSVLWGNMNPFLGMFRTVWLKECPVVNTVGADLIILTRLSLKGDFIHAVDTSWCRREFRHESSYAEKLNRYKSKKHGFSPSVFAHAFPLARLPVEIVKGVLESGVPFNDKLIILFLLGPTLAVRYLSGRRSKA